MSSDLETVPPLIWGGFEKPVFVTFVHSDLSWAGSPYEAYDAVIQRRFPKLQAKSIYLITSIGTSITIMVQNHNYGSVQNHSNAQWQPTGINTSVIKSPSPHFFLVVGHFNTNLNHKS